MIRFLPWLVTAVVAAACAFGLHITRQSWGPNVLRPLASWLDPTNAGHGHEHTHEPIDAHEKSEDENRIELSEQAQQNIGLATIELNPDTFSRTITVPGIVTEKPGHSDVEVTAPLSGVVTQVYPLRGETVEPGDPLFRLRLTHEEIVQAQAELLKTTEELDVVNREIKRLEKITEGVVPGRTRVERDYEKQKLEAVQHAQMQVLVLHGLTEQQVQGILTDRKLLKEVLIYAPGREDSRSPRVELPVADPTAPGSKPDGQEPAGTSARSGSTEPIVDQSTAVRHADLNPAPPQQGLPGARPPLSDGRQLDSQHDNQSHRHSDLVPPRPRRFFELETLMIEQGQHVAVGKPLCKLGDHTSLYIEGRAFEREAHLLTNAVTQGWPVSAAFEVGGASPQIVPNLQIVYLANAVDSESRAFPFYVELTNVVARDAPTSEGHRFLSWKYKPGQRVQLLVPVEKWPNRLVVPAETVVQDGAETYVFQRNGDLFERRTVHVEYQDQRHAVLANDGSVFKGESIVVTGAYQLHLAIKNKSGTAIDPHAGHGH